MHIISLSEQETIAQTASNLLEAGILEQHEVDTYILYLDTLDPKDLLATLIESYYMLHNEGARQYYFIDMENMNLN